MDPWLEGDAWMSFHGQFIAEIARQLSPALRPKYVALMDQRVIWDSPEEDVWIDAVEARPDVSVISSSHSTSGRGSAMLVPPLTMATVVPAPFTVRSIEIRDVANRHLVCAIEVMSPTNKRGRGRRKYLAKRARILQSSAHLIEIDLLRDGQRIPMEGQLPPTPYFAFVSRSNTRPKVGVWPIALAERLPKIPIPLLAPDEDVVLDLQAAFTNVYDTVGYDLILDYSKPPPVRLSESEQRLIRPSQA